jgi:aspartate aminotransferase
MQFSPTLKAKIIKKERIEKNLPIYDAGLGENPMPCPKLLIKNIKKYADKNIYTGTSGIKELQNSLKSERLIVGNGLKPLTYLLQCCFDKLYSSGTIVHLLPAWTSYIEQINYIQPINYVQITCEDNFKISPSNLKKELKKCPQPIFLIFNNPCNPTGMFYEKNEIKAFAEIFEYFKVLVFCDNIYNKLIHSQYKKKYTCLSEYYDNVILGSGLSKNFSGGGYRFGWLDFKTNNTEILTACESMASNLYSCPSTLLQYSTYSLLNEPSSIKKYIIFQCKMYQDICNYCKERFNQMTLKCSNARAAFYIFLDFSFYKNKFKKIDIINSQELSDRLINDIGLITVPGCAFGMKGYYIRYTYIDIKNIRLIPISYNYENIKKGLNELRKWLNKLI